MFGEPLARAAARLGSFGSRVIWYTEIGSTNDAAAALADAGAEEGLVVAADAQTTGRGRLGRAWASPPGAGIYATIVLRPDAPLTPLLTLAAGVALAEGIQTATGLPASIKWPNDIFVMGAGGPASGRKLAGILAEAGTTSDGSSWVVLGFGINVLPAAYPPEIAARATCLEAELGRRVDRGLVLAECLAALWVRYDDLREQRTNAVLAAWRSRAGSTFGREVEWSAGGQACRGVAADVDERGALLVRQESGVATIVSGEVRWI